VIELPEYVKQFGYDFTVQITGIGIPRMFGCSRVEDGKFTVYGGPGGFFWLVHAKRSDIIVEPLKSTVEVKGDGPYKWTA
jgi:hypothetical protein